MLKYLIAIAWVLTWVFHTESHAQMAFLPLLIGGLVSLGTGLAGHLSQMSAEERAQALQEKGVQEWLKTQIPDPDKLKLALENFVVAGKLSPEMEGAFQTADTELKKIQVDPKLRQSRMRALGALEEKGYGGESLEDRAAQQGALIESGAANRGRQEAVIGDLARRGQLGGGQELSARMDAAQAEGDRLAGTSANLESERRRRAYEALLGAGDLAGKIEGDEYNMKSDAAKAADTINMFNTTNKQAVSGRNVDRTNNAAQWNLTNEQDIANKNTAKNNFEQQYNKELYQQQFDNQAKKAAGLAGQYGQQADSAVRSGQSAANMWGKLGTSAAGLGAAAYRYGQKKDEDDDA